MESLKLKFKNGFSTSDLKIFALIFMIIDHISAVIIENGYFYGLNISNFSDIATSSLNVAMFNINYIARLIGRISFPIFCFLIVQGFINTSSRKKYIFRVGIFSLLSEIPYDLSLDNSMFSIKHQNVLIAFLLGLIMLCILEKFDKKYFVQFIIVGSFCLISNLLKVDYTYIGMLFIAFFYIFRAEVDKTLMLLFSGVLCIYKYSGFFYSGALSLVFIGKYNGEKGRGLDKYFFYVFYPAHLLVLVVIRYFIYGIIPS